MPVSKSSSTPNKLGRRSFLFLSGAALVTGLSSFTPPALAQSVYLRRSVVAGVPLYQTVIDLSDPHTFLAIGLANNPNLGNPYGTNGDESFGQMVARYHAAFVTSGTFFSLDAERRIMGNLVSGGEFLRYSPNENYGTTLGIRAGNRPELITARVDGRPSWHQHWFSITGGPRLLRNGRVWLAPRTEGFRDPRIFGVAARSAIGFPASGKKLILVTFLRELSLSQEARVMRAIGCSEAMNLDGGSSSALAYQGRILMQPGRELTNVIVAYDARHPAPRFLRDSWFRFQAGDRPG
ncbi:phosphodiester glycosidase family protein [Oscillatoria sp. FACHB-1407]|uniref:phosphodiester glycosidase family protein n=1 Tax=Oscillatoria sp. FACHB-1407 TaxID=2692847 RepID=UPI001682650E|nr:phosphodiester glycosidase family protein [Oscillatoria sp. FACHB-1407]MBD2460850.1 phosphodiester glycosidase family protein [Oscillatoria sp. FACHB-1407]